jgi:gentisate 1,2-dioxygenase
MNYLHVIGDDDGTRFEDRDVAFEAADFAPPGPPLDVSASTEVSGLQFIRLPAGWTDPSHPAPARQWMLILSGRGETTAGGETRQWGPGDVVLLEDTEPPGHGTTVHEEACIAVVRC